MPGALTTLLANNAMHMIPGGRRKKTRKGGRRRRGGYTDPEVVQKEQVGELMNRYGCKTKEECIGKITAMIEESSSVSESDTLYSDLGLLRSYTGARRKTRKTRRS